MAFLASSECVSSSLKQLSRWEQSDPGVQRDKIRGQSRENVERFRSQARSSQISSNDFRDFWPPGALYLPQESLNYLWWQKNTFNTSQRASKEVPISVSPESWVTSFLDERLNINHQPLARNPRQIYCKAAELQGKDSPKENEAKTLKSNWLLSQRSAFPSPQHRLNPYLRHQTHTIDNVWIQDKSLCTRDCRSCAIEDGSIPSAEWDTIFTEVEKHAMAAYEYEEIDHKSLNTELDYCSHDLNIDVTSTEEPRSTRCFQNAPRSHNYDFQQNNPFSGSWRAFEEGMTILQKEGNLAIATLAFEASSRKDPLNFEAWKMLGLTQAENENDEAAIKAFKDALELDPTDGDVLLGLAISYINEDQQQKAYTVLENWLTSKYPQLDFHSPPSEGLHTRITSLYLSAARLHPSGPQLDPNVQIGLGMLFFSTSHYTESLDCFSTALSLVLSSPVPTTARSPNSQCQSHLLYNRIGASLAGLRRYDEAVDTYEMALVAKPNFVRARYNLAVVAFSRGEYEEAAKQAVRALVEREAGRAKVGNEMERGRVEDDLTTTLRRALVNMGRWDLSETVRPGMGLRNLRSALDV